MSQITKINGVPIANTSVSAFTYGDNVFTIGNTNGTSYSALINTMTGLTINGSLSATTYLGLPIDVWTTGATYSNNTFTFTNNTGGTFNVLFNTVTGLTINGDITVTGTTNISGTTNINSTLNVNGNTNIRSNSYFLQGTNTSNGVVSLIGVDNQDRVYIGNQGYLNYIADSTIINGNLTATTISATTYYNLPTDVYVTGGTYSAGTAIFTNNTGGTFNVTGFSTSTATEFTGGTVTGATIFTGGLSANTISATTYYNLPTDVYVTGASYNNNSFTFTNNTGGTFNVLFNTVTGLTVNGNLTATTISATTYQNLPTDVYVTGGTYSAGTAIFTNNTGGTFNVTGFSTGSATGGTSSRITGSTTTTTSGNTTLSQISGLTSDSTHYVEAYVTAKSSGTTAWATYKRTLNITTSGSTPTIRFTNSDFDYFSNNLSATTVNFAVSGTNVNINVSGVTDTNIQWDSAYEIIVKSTKV